MRRALFVLLAACAEHPTAVFVATPQTAPPAPAHFEPKAHVPETCEDAIDDKRELTASGKGAKHPDMVAVDAVLAECDGPSPPERLLRTRPRPRAPTCGEATLERAAALALGKGPNHPRMLYLDATLATCSSTKPTPEECLAVMRERLDLEARGYGPRHPDMIANDAKRALCP